MAQQISWLQAHLATMGETSSTDEIRMLADYLAGASTAGHQYLADFYGCLSAAIPVRTFEWALQCNLVLLETVKGGTLINHNKFG